MRVVVTLNETACTNNYLKIGDFFKYFTVFYLHPSRIAQKCHYRFLIR